MTTTTYPSADLAEAKGMLVEASKLCVERMNAIGYKGKKRDDASLDYLCGVATGLKLAGKVYAHDYFARVLALDIAFRGYVRVAFIADKGLDS